jgi:5-methylcytosine-specific restriction endonuclease McrA
MPMTKICSNCNKRTLQKEVCQCKMAWNKTVSNEKNQQYAEEKKFFNSSRWKKKRKRIIDRDGAHCQRCLIKYNVVTANTLEVHHIKPRNKYPELRWEEKNLITLCKSCNTTMGTKGVLDFVPLAEDEFVNYAYHL